MRTSSGDLSIAKSSQSCVVRKRRMINNEQPSSDILAWLDICSMKLSQTAIVTREDNVEDVNDDDIGKGMNKQVPIENMSPIKAKLNYN